MDIFNEIKKRNFPIESYVVFGGAAIAAREIRKTHDVDILVTLELLEQCRRSGAWKDHPRINPNEPAGLDNGAIELYPTIGSGITSTFKELRDSAEIINGIPFCSLEDIILIKRAYGREKDFKDIELINKYLKQ
jgi:hypothetical protein